MLRRVSWRFWVLIAILVGAYIGAGAIWDHNARVTEDVNNVAWLALFFAPLTVLVVTTATQKWWLNDLGVNLVMAVIGLMPLGGILAWVFFRDHGSITTSAMAWAFIGCPLWTAGWLLWRAYLFLRIKREETAARRDNAE